MNNGLKIISPGVYTSIQDLGRFGYRKYGVPVSGALDLYSAKLANALLNNSLDTPVMEMLMSGARLQFEWPTVFVLTGANFSPLLNGEKMDMHKPTKVAKGDVLSFQRPVYGNCCYLSVQGGFVGERVLGSCSQYDGVTKQSRLMKGSVVNYGLLDQPFDAKSSTVRVSHEHFNKHFIEVLKGPEFHDLPEEGLNKGFTIAPTSNRMAVQLSERLRAGSTLQMLTSSVMPGTVQLTPSGQLIILMRDCQTTGGYPRVLQLTEMAINHLAQRRAGEKFQFKLVENITS